MFSFISFLEFTLWKALSVHVQIFLSLSLSVFLSRTHKPCPSTPPGLRVLARSRLLQLKQIFPGSHRAIWAWFPLGLNPLSMFQIIYRESIESYTVMNSLLMAFSLSLHLYESQSTKVLLHFHLTPLLCFKSQSLIWFQSARIQTILRFQSMMSLSLMYWAVLPYHFFQRDFTSHT